MSAKSVAITLGIKEGASVLSLGSTAGYLTSIGVLPPEDALKHPHQTRAHAGLAGA
jgi:hypothetical protein